MSGIALTSAYNLTLGPNNTLSGIASDYEVSVQAIINANPWVQAALATGALSDAYLGTDYAGQVLVVPPSSTIAPLTPYTIQVGDSIASIAQAFGVTTTAILAANPQTVAAINSGLILANNIGNIQNGYILQIPTAPNSTPVAVTSTVVSPPVVSPVVTATPITTVEPSSPAVLTPVASIPPASTPPQPTTEQDQTNLTVASTVGIVPDTQIPLTPVSTTVISGQPMVLSETLPIVAPAVSPTAGTPLPPPLNSSVTETVQLLPQGITVIPGLIALAASLGAFWYFFMRKKS